MNRSKRYVNILKRLGTSVDDLEEEIESISRMIEAKSPGDSSDIDRNLILIELAEVESRIQSLRKRLASRPKSSPPRSS